MKEKVKESLKKANIIYHFWNVLNAPCEVEETKKASSLFPLSDFLGIPKFGKI